MNRILLLSFVLLLWSFSSLAQVAGGAAAKEAVTVKGGTVPSGCRSEVAPLIDASWHQDAPYNGATPVDSATGRHCATGCIATALGQIMYYYKYPKKLSDGTVIDWDNILPVYQQGAYTEAQGSAVALLVARCGRAVKMHYGPYVSVSYPKEAADGVVTDFGFIVRDYGYRDYPKSPNYDVAKWKEVVYRELSAGRPVLYGGTSYKHGEDKYFSHSFILDGYDKEGRVHVNYGFGGSGNGFFDIDHLPMKYVTYDGQQVDEEFDTYQTLVVIHRPEDGPIEYDLSPLE